MPSERLLNTTAQTKARLNIKNTKLRALIRDGKLDARKLGRLTMITEESVHAYVDSLPRFQSKASQQTEEAA